MKKKLDTNGIMNELKSGSRFFAPAPHSMPTHQTTPLSTEQSTDGSIDQSIHQSSAESADASSPRPVDRSAILGRPKAFYITAQQDADLDHAVQQLAALAEGKVGQKIDRSTLVRLLLEQADLKNPDTAHKLYNQLVSRLISQLTG